jgi:hypothetical protein
MNPRSSAMDRGDLYDWSRSTYRLRVRSAKIFLWGSAGVSDQSFNPQLILHIRNDMFGVEIHIGTQTAAGGSTPIGTLEPGECLSLPINHICGVYATCTQESIVSCRIMR